MEQILLSAAEAAKQLDVSKPTIYRLCNRSDFPTIRFGRSLKIPKEPLEDWVRQNIGEKVVL